MNYLKIDGNPSVQALDMCPIGEDEFEDDEVIAVIDKHFDGELPHLQWVDCRGRHYSFVTVVGEA